MFLNKLSLLLHWLLYFEIRQISLPQSVSVHIRDLQLHEFLVLQSILSCVHLKVGQFYRWVKSLPAEHEVLLSVIIT
jgi:hypothetical protein